MVVIIIATYTVVIPWALVGPKGPESPGYRPEYRPE
jgi:hypothetical protein